MLSYIIINILIQILNFIIYSIDHFNCYVFRPSIISITFLTLILRILYDIIFTYYNISGYDLFFTLECAVTIGFIHIFGIYYFDVETESIESLMDQNNSLIVDINNVKQENFILKRNYNNLKEYNIKLKYKLPDETSNNTNVITNLNDISNKLSSIIDKLGSENDDLIVEKMENYNNKIIDEVLNKYLDHNTLNNVRRHFRRILRETKNL